MTRDPLGTGTIELSPVFIRAEVRRYLDEDVGTGDATTKALVGPNARARGRIVAREPCVVAGLEIARAVFEVLDGRVRFDASRGDGSQADEGAILAAVEGWAAAILTGERVALNIMQRLSGVATLTRRYVDTIAGTGATISSTRKTTPGLRLFEKYAVGVGGGRRHRVGLYDGVLVKDNHIVAAGGLEPALRSLAGANPIVPVQVEVDSLDQLATALASGVRAFLLDNMTPGTVAEAVRLVRRSPAGAECWIEASGGITIDNVRAYAETGVDTISIGALTHSSPSVDIALDLEPFPTGGDAHGDA
ncbi:MAG: carboxylating nicotinate-nucleotide diphosphorylase [Acidobacteriota bacterium]